MADKEKKGFWGRLRVGKPKEPESEPEKPTPKKKRTVKVVSEENRSPPPPLPPPPPAFTPTDSYPPSSWVPPDAGGDEALRGPDNPDWKGLSKEEAVHRNPIEAETLTPIEAKTSEGNGMVREERVSAGEPEDAEESGDEYEEEAEVTPPRRDSRRNESEEDEETQYLSRADLKVIIFEKYEEGHTAFDISKYLKREKVADADSGNFLGPSQVGGYRSQFHKYQEAQKQSQDAPPTPSPVEQPPATEPPKRREINIPPPRTKLDIFVEMLDKGLERDNEGLVRIAAEGIYAQMNQADGAGGGGGINTEMFGLLKTVLKDKTDSDPIQNLGDLADVMKKLMPQGGGESETVGLANAVGHTIENIGKDVTDTIRDVTGSKGKADDKATCPNCNKIIPREAMWCPFCGLSFQTQGKEEEEDEEMNEAQKRAQEAASQLMEKRQPKQLPPGPAGPPQDIPPQPQSTPEPNISDSEQAQFLRHLQRLANFIAHEDDPILKTNALYKAGDDEDKKNALFLAIMGRERIINAGRKLIELYPQFAENVHYIDLCESVEGQEYIDISMNQVKELARAEKLFMTEEEAVAKLTEVEQKLGFEIE